MLAVERRNLILEKLQEEKKVIVSELSQEFQVSEETIRRDLEKLDRDGLAIKSYGGAVLNENTSLDMPFNVRQKNNPTGKQKIAKLVEGLIEDGDHIILDPSTTAVFIARALKSKERLTVITNSVEIIVELFDVPEWNVISTGGLSRERSFALVGPNTNRMISSYHVDKAIISCKAVNMATGMMDSDEQDACSKRLMLGAAKERILVADNSKFDKMAFAKVAEWTELTKVVTDQEPSREWQREFERLRIECVYPGKGKAGQKK